MAVDSAQELTKFRLSNPLRRLCDQCMEKDSERFLNAVLGYDTYFEYLVLIWTRFVQEFTQYDACRRALDQHPNLLEFINGILEKGQPYLYNIIPDPSQ
ncbi:MAG: hypothetical protein DLM72_19500 [Candidatus Nitrosopolaris wilkensis]|nr:MAG: hypothetical protein DLM72_19500 [Candidatus Nitrosopolaris wilkensis]